jgi:hypothetical protein
MSPTRDDEQRPGSATLSLDDEANGVTNGAGDHDAPANGRRAPAARRPATRRGKRPAARPGVATVRPTSVIPTGDALPDAAPWRDFVGRWLAASGCTVSDAARGDWEVALSPALQKRWRRQRVRLVFDPARPTLPRGAWFTAPGSGGGRRILEAACEEPFVTRRTALVRVPGAPEDGIASVCRVRGLAWGPPRLGPVRYERRVAFHCVVTLWGGLPAQESWVMLVGPDGELLEWERGAELPDVRSREGLYQIADPLSPEACDRLAGRAREHLDGVLAEREEEWEHSVGRLREDELGRLANFFSARIEEEEERSRRRSTGNGEESEMEGGDTTSLKLEWERRAAEVRHRWALRTEVRLWGLEEWSWPIADLSQELRAGAIRLKLESRVDVARGRPALPACPGCGAPAEMLVRARGAVACVRCAP